jgi:hypothetical protein
MPEDSKTGDPGSVWRNQPDENLPVNAREVVRRRTDELSSSTRWEILMSIGAALLLVAVAAWRLQVVPGAPLEAAFAAVLVWVVTSVVAFRHCIWPERPLSDAMAASGVEHYRRELIRRRDHLRNEWLWHGPLVSAVIVFLAVWMGRANVTFRSFSAVLPLIILLVVWTTFGIRRRWMQAKAIQDEIDELEKLAGGN